MSQKRLEGLPGIVWQGMKSDIDEIYHLLDDYEVVIAQSDDHRLLIDMGFENYIVLSIGDKIVIDQDDETDSARVAVLRMEQATNGQDHSGAIV